MAREWGIASLILAVLAWFVPFYGMFITGVAVLLAVVGAAMGDRTFSGITPVIGWTNLYMGSPLFWAAVNGASQTHKISTDVIYFGVGTVVAIPYFVMTFAKRKSQNSPSAISLAHVPAVDVGEETWRSITGSRNRSLLEGFVQRFPGHPRVLMVQSELAVLDASQQVQQPEVTPSAAAVQLTAHPQSARGPGTAFVLLLLVVCVGAGLAYTMWPSTSRRQPELAAVLTKEDKATPADHVTIINDDVTPLNLDVSAPRDRYMTLGYLGTVEGNQSIDIPCPTKCLITIDRNGPKVRFSHARQNAQRIHATAMRLYSVHNGGKYPIEQLAQ